MPKKDPPAASEQTERTERKPKMLVNRLKPNQTPADAIAAMMVEGLAMNAVTAVSYSKALGEVDLSGAMFHLTQETERVHAGHLESPEAILMAQAVTLNAMFTQLAYEATKVTLVDHMDRLTRLAFKAQGQCRATLETLAVIKNPPTVFARQANFAQGPQQVNNLNQQVNNVTQDSRAEDSGFQPNKLLEAHGERLDVGTASATSGSDYAMAPVGAVDRAANGQGKGSVLEERRSRRAAAEIPGDEPSAS